MSGFVNIIADIDGPDVLEPASLTLSAQDPTNNYNTSAVQLLAPGPHALGVNVCADMPEPASVASLAPDPNNHNKNKTSAMQLFAPDPNAPGVNTQLDLDELFHDCYFGDFSMPEDVPSAAPPAAPKRTADQAGLPIPADTTTTPRAPTSAGRKAGGRVRRQPSVEDGGLSARPTASLTDGQKVERRTRNREHAKRSRLRKKFLLESLQEQVDGLQDEISTLKSIVHRELPDRAQGLLKDVGYGPDGGDDGPGLPMPSGFGPVKTLMKPDYRLMSALSGSQQNFAISDPGQPDNPIVFVSQGFLDLTGYTLDQVLGRNCRFLQGPGTDQAAVDVIRRGVTEGTDTSVCLLNYKADGTPFWNQFFVAPLRDAQDRVVNFVGVQCEVSKAVVEKHISEGKTPPG